MKLDLLNMVAFSIDLTPSRFVRNRDTGFRNTVNYKDGIVEGISWD